MARAISRWFGPLAFVSTMTLMSAAAWAQPQSAAKPTATNASAAKPAAAKPAGAVPSAQVRPPKVDAKAQPAWSPAAVDRTVAEAVAQIIDSMHRLAHLVPPQSVAPPPTPTPSARPAATPVVARDKPRPKQVALVIRPKPVDVAPPTSTPTDARGQSATLLGIEARLPWQKP